MSNLGNLHGLEVVAIEKVLQHANPALVGFYQVTLSDRSKELVAPSEAEAYVRSSQMTREGLEAADKAAEEQPVASSEEEAKGSDLGGSGEGSEGKEAAKAPKARASRSKSSKK